MRRAFRAADLSAIYGISRSLAIYYGLPYRGRQLRQFYRQFVRKEDLCFDVGAHVGNRSRALSQLGARVVAVEPHPTFASFLRRSYSHQIIVEKAVGASRGTADLLASRRTPTVSTLSTEWASNVGRSRGFRHVNWDQSYPVTVTTLDELVEEYGLPHFCKLDIEGSELSALRGLSQPIPLLSFEFLPVVVQDAIDCMDRLGELSQYEFNWTRGESYRFRSRRWLTSSRMSRHLLSMPSDDRAGDIYARQNS